MDKGSRSQSFTRVKPANLPASGVTQFLIDSLKEVIDA
jgi:hypothetical protein